MSGIPAFYPILDTAIAAHHGIDVVSAAEKIFEGGARILQFRHKAFWSRNIFADLQRVGALCRDAGALLVVNDRADIARLAGAALHLGQDDLTPGDARRVVDSGTIIGFSTHNEHQFREALMEPVDYVALGPIFGTSSKLHADPVVGLEELRRLRPLTERPMVAIGGITRENGLAALGAGADSLAVIGDLFTGDGNLRERVEEWIRIAG